MSAIAMATDVYEVIVVGAGTTGAAAVYHLADAGVKNILCLEMGTPGMPGWSPDRFARYVAEEVVTWGPLVRASGATVD